MCAAYEYEREVAQPLLTLLPPLLHISPRETAGFDSVNASFRLLHRELSARAAGWRTMVDRLIDVLFVQVLRAWIDGTH
ncbi:cupin domain-containing protein, partial [Salmonella sp. SAL4448]|uniref:cupin domain-containing protein n=1 Tax=Salmonella sp. SAL4448 TaxID=3159903 RepID=UPI0039794DC1